MIDTMMLLVQVAHSRECNTPCFFSFNILRVARSKASVQVTDSRACVMSDSTLGIYSHVCDVNLMREGKSLCGTSMCSTLMRIRISIYNTSALRILDKFDYAAVTFL